MLKTKTQVKEMNSMRVLITGTAGFIGFHLAKLLLDNGVRVHGYDGMTDYYDVNLKHKRNEIWLDILNFLIQLQCWKIWLC